MARSLKKGPYVEEALQTKIEKNKINGKRFSILLTDLFQTLQQNTARQMQILPNEPNVQLRP